VISLEASADDGTPHAGEGSFPPPGVRGVVFDVVGTLVEPWPPVAEAYRAAAARHGLPCDTTTIRERFTAAWRREEAADAEADPPFATSPDREVSRWRAIVDGVFPAAPQGPAIFTDLWEHFARPQAWRPLAAGVELVDRALAANAVVALASNFDERLLAIAPHLEPLARVEHVFVSSLIGWRKPAPQFFAWIAGRLGLQPADLLLVGDDPVLDVEAARRVGWRAHGIT
jgi:putative hydrolase of the HAD superfamily